MLQLCVLDKEVKQLASGDPYLISRKVDITKQGLKGPDFLNTTKLPHESDWYDLTTQKAWSAHQRKYAGYGSGTGVFWN